MLLAQISDLHVRPDGILYQGVVDSNAMLRAALARLARLDRVPDLMLVTGDLVDEGRPEEYQKVHELLAQTAIPYLIIPGNHDNRENLRRAFPEHDYLPKTGSLHYCIDDFPVRIVALDSTVPGAHHGAIDVAGLDWLAATLEANPSKPTLVMLHHPPFLSGIPYLDKYRYVGAAAFGEIIASVNNIEAVLCGHVHRAMTRRWAGTIVCACPSTTTEIALQLAANAPPESYLAPGACMLHLWEESTGLISHVKSLGDYPGPHPFA
jgi:3',5'-cyclic AMP phosphodiesterase CpdA